MKPLIVHKDTRTVLLYEKRRSREEFACPGCHTRHSPGSLHFHLAGPRWAVAREPARWCVDCLTPCIVGGPDIFGRFSLLYTTVRGTSGPPSPDQQAHVYPLVIRLCGIASILSHDLETFTHHLVTLTAEEFEDLVCERLSAMGLDVHKTGRTHQADGGIDIIFRSRAGQLPFIGAAQVKSHRRVHRKDGPSAVRDFAGVIRGYPFSVGLLVTNTAFTPSAAWYAKNHGHLLRLRDASDMRRWLLSQFDSHLEWREIPDTLEIAPGLIVPLR